MDADAVTAQVSGWETVANLEIIDHILIGTDEKGAPVHAIPFSRLLSAIFHSTVIFSSCFSFFDSIVL